MLPDGVETSLGGLKQAVLWRFHCFPATLQGEAGLLRPTVRFTTLSSLLVPGLLFGDDFITPRHAVVTDVNLVRASNHVPHLRLAPPAKRTCIRLGLGVHASSLSDAFVLLTKHVKVAKSVLIASDALLQAALVTC